MFNCMLIVSKFKDNELHFNIKKMSLKNKNEGYAGP